MTWAKHCDNNAHERWYRALSLQAARLWVDSVWESGKLDSNGVLSEMEIDDVAHRAKFRPVKPLAELIAAGRFHDPTSLRSCPVCRHGGDWWPGTPKLPEGSVLIHEWWVHLLDNRGKDDALERWRTNRRKALNRDLALVAAVRHRDHDRCRYCGVLTADSSGPDKRSPTLRTIDHIDPWCKEGPGGYGNVLWNLAVACRACNGRKCNRWPSEWVEADGSWDERSNPSGGRLLLPEPGTDREYPTQIPERDRAYLTQDPE